MYPSPKKLYDYESMLEELLQDVNNIQSQEHKVFIESCAERDRLSSKQEQYILQLFNLYIIPTRTEVIEERHSIKVANKGAVKCK